MNFCAIFIAFFFLSITVFAANINRILGGAATPPGLFNFVAAFHPLIPSANGTAIGTCTSTIISPRHILTAAHCYRYLGFAEILAANETRLYKVNPPETVAGLFDFRKKNKVERDNKLNIVQIQLKEYGFSAKVFIHASYTGANSLLNDIAIVEFPEGTDLKIPPIKLASDYQEKDGDSAIAAGYGIYKMIYDPKTGDPVDGEFPEGLHNVTVEFHSIENCAASEICTGNSDRGVNVGDSGPLFLERNEGYYQIGLTSHGMQKNAVFTRLSLHCDWIAKVTKCEVECVPLPSEDGTSSSTESSTTSNATKCKDHHPLIDNNKSAASESTTTEMPSNASPSENGSTPSLNTPKSDLIVLHAGVSLLLSVVVFSAICCVFLYL